MRKPIIILSSLFLFSTLLHISCSKNDDDGCGGPVTRTACYKMKNVQALPYNYTTKNTVGTTDSVRKSDFALQLNVENESVMCLNKKRDVGFMNTAYACTPVDPDKYKARLIDYTIKSDKAINSQVSVATDLKEYFILAERNTYEDLAYYFDDFASELNYTHYLRLAINNINPDTYRFTVTFIYEDGIRETATTSPVRIVQ